MWGDIDADLLFRTTVERGITRAMAFFDTTEIEISDWLNARPEIRRLSDLGSGCESEWLLNHIDNHSSRGLNLSNPSEQQIDFETASQDLALPDLVLTAAVVILITRRIRGSFIPSPNFHHEDRTADCTLQQEIEIAILTHSKIAGRLDGRALTGPWFFMRLGPTFGARVVGLRDNPHQNLSVLMSSREFTQQDGLLSDFRRHATALSSFAQFLGRVEVVFHGLGFSRTLNFSEAILMLMDVVTMTRRRTNTGSFLRQLSLAQPEDNREDRSSLPSWFFSGDDDEQN